MNKKVFLIFALLCAVVQGAWSESVTFRVCSWDDVNKQVVTTNETEDATVLEGEHPDDWVGLTNGYYLVKSNTKYKVLNIMGDNVHLILSGGATLSSNHVKLEGTNKLHIHDVADDNTGKLYVKNSILVNVRTNVVGAGISPTYDGIYKYAAGIGSGGGIGVNMGSLYVHGGTVEVITSSTGAAIGGGEDGSIDGEVVIYGGTVIASSLYQLSSGAGIGGGYNRSQGGPVTIYGGTVTAIADLNSAGIGGGGNGGHGDKVTIYGGTVTVEGGKSAAGIGGGSDGGNSGPVTIYGGNVSVSGGEEGACIGGGDNGDQGAPVAIYGGIVNIGVKKGFTVIYDHTNAIGGGHKGKGGEVLLEGGKITLLGGKRARALGGDASLGSVKIADNLRVAAGSEYPDIERVFTNGEREAACMWRNYAIIETCDHTTPTKGSDTTDPIYYTKENDATYHTKHCRYCNKTWDEEHAAQNCVCGQTTNFYRYTVYQPSTDKNTYDSGSTIVIPSDRVFYLPACKNVPKGYIFKGWEMNPESVGNWAAVRGGDQSADINMPAGTPVNTYLGQDKEVKFYARFLYAFTPTWTWAENGSSASVTLRHEDLNAVTLSSTDATPKVTIESADLKETVTIVNNDETTSEQEVKIGTRYTATCIYELNGYEYTFTDTYDILDVPATVDISLQDNVDNSETISGKYKCPVNATLAGRTLYKDGSWNTLCLPFDLTIAGSPLEGATVKTLESSDYNSENGTLTLNFTTDNLTTLSAGTPYIVKWDKPANYTAYDGSNASTCSDIVAPTFSGVTVSTFGGGHADTHYVDFVGSFSPVSLTANDKTVLYLGADNKLYYPSQDRTMGSCRAVFRLHNGLTAGDLVSGGAKATRFVMNFGDDETTGISLTPGPSPKGEGSEYWYDLQGRRLTGKPTAKGLYINNGKKVVIK